MLISDKKDAWLEVEHDRAEEISATILLIVKLDSACSGDLGAPKHMIVGDKKSRRDGKA
jgi:hypothetical protein